MEENKVNTEETIEEMMRDEEVIETAETEEIKEETVNETDVTETEAEKEETEETEVGSEDTEKAIEEETENKTLSEMKPGFAESFMNFSKKAASAIGKGIDVTAAKLSDTKEEMDRMRYAPVMASEFTNERFVMPRMLRTIEDDHQRVDVCQGAVAFVPVWGRAKVLEMTLTKIEEMGVILKPYTDGVFYLKNPYVEKEYLVIDEYFEMMRAAKICEILKVIKCAGAKEAIVTLRKEKKSFAFLRSDDTGRNEAGKSAYDGSSETDSVLLGVIANEKFDGTNEESLELKYFDNDPEFTEFIEKLNDKQEMEYSFPLGCDLSEENATDIDLALEKLDLSTANSLRKEIDEEKLYYVSVKVSF